MKDGYRVFDSDMHVLEPADLWERYIDPAFRHRAPRGTTRTPMDVGVTVDGADAFTLSGQIARVSFQGGLARFADDIARGFDARAQLTAMDRYRGTSQASESSRRSPGSPYGGRAGTDRRPS